MITINYSLQSINFFFRVNKNKGLRPTKFYHEKDGDFFDFDRTPLYDSSISWGAQGLIGTFLSKPAYNIYSIHDIFLWSADDRGTVVSYLIELLESGYLEDFRIYNN
ncbi:MAG: hypothetical protein GH151_13770 [Bacteroidetes bacterium]|nr:hypothetical protein [Bacteroidota bacterium]